MRKCRGNAHICDAAMARALMCCKIKRLQAAARKYPGTPHILLCRSSGIPDTGRRRVAHKIRRRATATIAIINDTIAPIRCQLRAQQRRRQHPCRLLQPRLPTILLKELLCVIWVQNSRQKPNWRIWESEVIREWDVVECSKTRTEASRRWMKNDSCRNILTLWPCSRSQSRWMQCGCDPLVNIFFAIDSSGEQVTRLVGYRRTSVCRIFSASD